MQERVEIWIQANGTALVVYGICADGETLWLHSVREDLILTDYYQANQESPQSC